MEFTNSPLAVCLKLAPASNHFGRRKVPIDTITIHCYVGQVSIERASEGFANPKRGASCTYAIGYDGRVALICEEKNASGCSNSYTNDNRAVTIEVACDNFHPYAVAAPAYQALIRLVADICKRNGIPELRWRADPSIIGQVDKQNMTVHRWFAAKACPGDWLFVRHGEIAEKVNRILKEERDLTEKEVRAVVREELSRIEQERQALPPSEWAVPYVQAAADAGVMAKMPDGGIERPRDHMTREELAVVAAALERKIRAVDGKISSYGGG